MESREYTICNRDVWLPYPHRDHQIFMNGITFSNPCLYYPQICKTRFPTSCKIHENSSFCLPVFHVQIIKYLFFVLSIWEAHQENTKIRADPATLCPSLPFPQFLHLLSFLQTLLTFPQASSPVKPLPNFKLTGSKDFKGLTWPILLKSLKNSYFLSPSLSTLFSCLNKSWLFYNFS